MASVCFYFQVHQPPRLRRYSVFETSTHYFDDQRNNEILRKVANKCYLPATQLLRRLIDRHEGEFRISFSLSGCVTEQFRQSCPEVIDSFCSLAETGCCEFLAETYYHSLAFLYSRDEFRQQVEMHSHMIEDLFGQKPAVFRNTELIYNNEMAAYIAGLDRYIGMLAEGTDFHLDNRSPNHLYTPPGRPELTLMLKNYRLSDDIAFRFSNRNWKDWPLTAEKFANWVNQINGTGHVCNLFMDFETFGEHQWQTTGIFEFLEQLPGCVLANNDDFKTPSECMETYEPVGEYDVPHMTSWADTERDLSAWLGNAMQSSALHELYRMEQRIKETGDEQLIHHWRLLTTSDHFYYMCTKYFDDAVVHRYFNPYESPYDSYINFMNVLDNMRSRVDVSQAGAAIQA